MTATKKFLIRLTIAIIGFILLGLIGVYIGKDFSERLYKIIGLPMLLVFGYITITWWEELKRE